MSKARLSTWADKALKVRPGGRSTVSGVVATVFGSTGFLGRYVVNRLGSVGVQCVLPYRGEPDDTRHMKLMGDLGMINSLPFDPRYDDSIYEAVKHSNVVINLIGREWPTSNYSLTKANLDTAEKIARVSADAGVKRFIHISALGAGNPNTKSEFHKAKRLSEHAVFSYHPQATILRPATMFGEEDRFINSINFLARLFGVVPLANKGNVYFKPVFVDDVAEAVLAALNESDVFGKVLELEGPEGHFWGPIAREILDKSQFRDVPIVNSSLLLRGFSQFTQRIYTSEKYLSADMVIRMNEEYTATEDGFQPLGIKPLPLSAELGFLTYKYRSPFEYD